MLYLIITKKPLIDRLAMFAWCF